MGPVMRSAGSLRYGPTSIAKGNPGVTLAAGTLAVGFGALDVVVSVLLMPVLVIAPAITTLNVVL